MHTLTWDRRSLTDQVCDDLRAALGGADFPVGSRLPSEIELAGRYQVARTTVREALKALESDGLVVVRHGRGRFVSGTAGLQMSRPITNYESVTTQLETMGFRTTTRVLGVETGRAVDFDARGLGDQEVVTVRRARVSGTDALVYSEDTVLLRLFEDHDTHDWTGSIIDALTERGSPPIGGTASISARPLPARAEIERERGEIRLLVEELSLSHTGEAILFSRNYYDAVTFSFTVGWRTR